MICFEGEQTPLHTVNMLLCLPTQAGIAGLKKAKPAAAAAKPKATPKGAKKAAFVPDSQELLKLRAREDHCRACV